jgi:hypothetical protein
MERRRGIQSSEHTLSRGRLRFLPPLPRYPPTHPPARLPISSQPPNPKPPSFPLAARYCTTTLPLLLLLLVSSPGGGSPPSHLGPPLPQARARLPIHRGQGPGAPVGSVGSRLPASVRWDLVSAWPSSRRPPPRPPLRRPPPPLLLLRPQPLPRIVSFRCSLCFLT